MKKLAFNPTHPVENSLYGQNSLYSHLLSLGARGGSAGIGFDKSSKLIMYNEISSTSERIGAITSEQRNVVPVCKQTKCEEKKL